MLELYGAQMPLRVLEEIRFWKQQEREHTEVIRALAPKLEPEYVRLMQQWEAVFAATENGAQMWIEAVIRQAPVPSPDVLRQVNALVETSINQSQLWVRQLLRMENASAAIRGNPTARVVVMHIIRESEYFLGVLQAYLARQLDVGGGGFWAADRAAAIGAGMRPEGLAAARTAGAGLARMAAVSGAGAGFASGVAGGGTAAGFAGGVAATGAVSGAAAGFTRTAAVGRAAAGATSGATGRREAEETAGIRALGRIDDSGSDEPDNDGPDSLGPEGADRMAEFGMKADVGAGLTGEGTWSQLPGEERQAVPIGGHRLPPLPYAYDALEPHIDAATMRLHHDILHKKYVDDLNKAELMMQQARKSGNFDLIRHWEREAAFNGAGHYLHTIFWNIMSPRGGGSASGPIARQIEQDYGGFPAFRKHFSEAAAKVEGPGWAILVWSPRARRTEILQAEKHQNLSQWDVIPLLVLDVWEHSYLLKYRSERPAYVEAWWHTVNWSHVNERFESARRLVWHPY